MQLILILYSKSKASISASPKKTINNRKMCLVCNRRRLSLIIRSVLHCGFSGVTIYSAMPRLYTYPCKSSGKRCRPTTTFFVYYFHSIVCREQVSQGIIKFRVPVCRRICGLHFIDFNEGFDEGLAMSKNTVQYVIILYN